MVSREGVPIKKPWTFMSNNEEVLEALSGHKCPGNHQHVIAEGHNTKPTGHYPVALATALHVAYAKHIRSVNVDLARYGLPSGRAQAAFVSL